MNNREEINLDIIGAPFTVNTWSMLPLSLETQVLTAFAYDPLSYIRIFLLPKVLKFGNKTNTWQMFCFLSTENIKIFEVAHTHELSGHRAESTTFNRVMRYFYWAGIFKWIEMLTLDCLSCQTSESERKDLNEAPWEPWGQLEAIPLNTLHIDNKGPQQPFSEGHRFCLVIVDAFSRFIQVYPSKNAEALETVNQLEKFITTFRIPQ